MESDPWDGGRGPEGGRACFIHHVLENPVFIAMGPNISSNISAVNYEASLKKKKKKKEKRLRERPPSFSMHTVRVMGGVNPNERKFKMLSL